MPISIHVFFICKPIEYHQSSFPLIFPSISTRTSLVVSVVPLPLKRILAGRFEHIWEGETGLALPYVYALRRIRKPE